MIVNATHQFFCGFLRFCWQTSIMFAQSCECDTETQQNANTGFLWKWCLMGIVRRFPMRKTSYYTAMALWGVFGVQGQAFTNIEGETAIGKKISGGLSALRDSGVIKLTSGKQRSMNCKRSGPRPQWRFTRSFSDYMRTSAGEEEYQCAADYISRVGVPTYRG